MSFYDEESHIWFGPKRTPWYNEEMNVGQLLMQVLEKTPNKITEISASSGNKLRCDEMRRKSIRVANALTQMGFKTGDRMMMVARNGLDIAPTMFGCFIIGAPINAVDISFSKDDIAYMINLLKPKMIFCDFDMLDKIYQALEDIGHRVHFVTYNDISNKALFIDQLYKVYCDEDNYKFPDTGDSKQLPAVIMCSSGTTGFPKGVCLSHSQLITQTFSLPAVDLSDILLQVSSMYWISGLTTLLMTTMFSATRITTTDPFSPKNFIDMIEKYDVTFIFGAPVMFSFMLKHPDVFLTDFSKVKAIYVGGSIVPPILKKSVVRVCKTKMYNIYGMSETVAIIAAEADDQESEGSVGRIAPNMKGKIVDEEWNSLGPNEVGQVLVQAKYQFLKYYDNEEDTQNAYTPDGWLITGDLGYFNDDGFLFIVGREKEMIRYMGYTMMPAEIEAIIQAMKGVIMCSVVGIRLDLYDIPAAAVVKHPDIPLTEADVQEAVASKLSDFKRLRGGVYFFETLPRTPSSKIKASAVREMVTKLYKERTEIEE